jgi:DNA-binding CsgD family transcriptional regulator/tetratricopeptide (TPR) repeat protein
MATAGEDGPRVLVGRDAELARLRALVDPVPREGRVLVVLGDAGMGKSMLLADVADRAGSAGMRVLSVTGRESESNLAFAGLHQLLRPVLPAVSGLPGRQASALQGALGLTPDPVAPDRLLTGIAVLTLLSDLSEGSPLAVVADDAHWLDQCSLDALAFAGHRLDAEPVVLVLGMRGSAPPAGLDRDVPELRLKPLSPSEARRLLDQQPQPPRGRARSQVLAQAAGNPMALIELARAIAADPAAARRWDAEPVPLTDRLAAVLAHRFGSLPEPTRAALLLAAVADGPDLRVAAGGNPGLEARALAPAEESGLIRVDQAGPRFSHPLVRSAIYHAAPFADRAAAHRRMAVTLHDQPDRRAWHLAAAAMKPDAQVASLLEETAAQAQSRGGAAAAALALERSAELSPSREEQARRLVSAASAAVTTGQADWVRDLAARAIAVTADPARQLAARHAVGWALTWSNQRSAALPALISVAREASGGLPALAWDALATAATVAHQSGAPADRQAVSRTLDHLLGQEGRLPSGRRGEQAGIEAFWLWIRACTDPLGSRKQVVPRLHRSAGSRLEEPSLSGFGATAWILDESDLAVQLLGEAVRRLRAPGVRGSSGASLTALGWAYIDTGRWDEALTVAAEASDLAEAYQMDMVTASAELISATVLAARSDAAAARAHAATALASIGPSESGLIAARARQVSGIAALGDGAHITAYDQLRQMFGPDGNPLHPVVSYLGLADLAAAAVRADRRIEGRDVVERALGHLGGTPSPRLEQVIARARGLLTGPAEAGAHFGRALSDPEGDRWPFERAQLRLDYAEWMRRRRRINEAKPLLIAALETFRGLQAKAWAQRAETELRACGVSVHAAPTVPAALAELTPQQRESVFLAGSGLTNREIGDRLYLSPRTVASHLYRSYPKLGISGRHQLHDLVARVGTPRGTSLGK